MQVTYQLTQRDFFDAFIAHRNRNAVTKWSFRVVVGIFLLVFAISALVLLARPNHQAVSTLAPLIVLAAMWALVIWALPWWQARNQFSKQPAVHGPRTLLMDAAGVHLRWDGGSSDIEWKHFIRSLETRDLFLLYTSPASFNMVPKRALTQEQLSDLRSFLAEHVSKTRRP